MDLYDVMRTAFAAREFAADPVDDGTLYRILENARFAPSGGNRQGWRVIVIRSPETKAAIADAAIPAARRYAAQVAAGENPWNTVVPTKLSPEQIAATPVPPLLTEPYRSAPVLLAVCVDLSVVASIDQELPRVGMASGASIYPFAWNILLAARNEGLGGTLTTMPIAREPDLQALLGLPPHVAVATIITLGRPAKQLTRLKRKPVEAFATLERFDGPPLTRPA
ncbi:MAG: nitroreductase family protein [Tepidiforma sp.]|jgi:nitroreductase|uniref:nitroreductase family protein n=1 Tax=Tepidiforma sp. TaxID=2682230 RepID=UPI0021DDFBFE|nr:nitroreductase family protein [Tepidiforma sp.]MCX7616781.1 nitroreductase family protein [Tepidiforma sp.]GIW19488.1 MAG: nitroreductase [Tepidiforma sp.]